MDHPAALMNSQLEALCHQASLQLTQLDVLAATSSLDQALALEPLCLSAHNLKEKHHLPGNFSQWMGVNAEISPDDDIFRFFAHHPTSKNPFRDYLSDGWRTMMELQELLDAAGLSVGRCQSFLEFACGHGRFTRHLARVYKNGQLTVSDVVPGSVEFLTSTLGVKGFYSSTDPNALNIPEKYEVIFVLSLFSHLPTAVWESWLQVLHAALKPGGLLIFSTHGEKCARLEGVDLGADGYRFFPSSESTALDGATYGSTFACLNYVQQAVAQALGERVKVTCHANHFWGNQDAIVVSA